ncbi:MAG: ABC transporter permease [Anaerotignum sp.]|nr:ABC transporter permease [Anaerotignum sp.]
MKGWFRLFLREWVYLCKRPRSLVLMILIPVFVTCICGSSYGKGYFSQLKMGVVDYSYSKQTREVVEGFRQSDYFDVVGYYEDEEAISQAMKNGEIVGCLIFPADFTKKLQLGQQAEVLLGSNAVNMGYGSTINLKGSEVLGTISTQMAVKSLVAKGETVEDALAAMNPVSFYTRQWYNPTNNFNFFLTFGFVIATVQQVLIYFAAISLAREKESGHLAEVRSISKNAAVQVTVKCVVYFIISLMTWLICSLIIRDIYGIPMRGSRQVWLAYSSLFLLSIITMGQFFSALMPNPVWATSLSLVFTSPSLVLSGYTWPTIALPAFYQKLAQVFPLTHFVIGYRNVALMGCGFEAIRGDMMLLAGISVVCMVLSIALWHWKMAIWEKKQNGETITEIKAAEPSIEA